MQSLLGFVFFASINMNRAERYKYVLDYFKEHSPRSETELHYGSPYELIVAVMLSAQCTDKRVNMVTPALFAAYPTVESMAQATADDVLPYIASVSYPNSKAAHIVSMARMVCEKFKGRVPDNMDDLLTLPGVGRKTANVVLGVAFGKVALAVDTHVYRVSHRVGLVAESCNTPFKVETELMKHIPREMVTSSHYWILLHGRYICKARRPECERCPITKACKYYADAEKKSKKCAAL